MNERYRRNFITAGALARETRAYGRSLIVKGASYNEVIAKIRRKIFDLGAHPAFPPQIALNHVAAHYLPDPDEDITFTDQIVKLDVGVCYEGAIGDCAVTVDLSGRHQLLIEAVESALMRAEQSLRVGQPIREIGRLIEETISSYGFNPIYNLSGHGLGEYKVHLPPQFPNYAASSSALIKPNMTFAIEPFATTGKGVVQEKGAPTLFAATSARPIRSPSARALLARIRTFRNLPFATHDLIDPEWTLANIRPALAELIQAGALMSYPPLVEETEGVVAQAENSIYVDGKGQVFVTTR